MDYDQISSWFMNSIWGVIVLGAIGSIVTICLIKLIKKLYGFYHYSRYKFKQREYSKGLRSGLALRHILKEKDTDFAIVFMLYQISMLILACTSFILIISFLSFLVSNKEGQILTVLSLVVSILLFLNGRWIYEAYREFRIPYKKYIMPILDNLSDDFHKDKAASSEKEGKSDS